MELAVTGETNAMPYGPFAGGLGIFADAIMREAGAYRKDAKGNDTDSPNAVGAAQHCQRVVVTTNANSTVWIYDTSNDNARDRPATSGYHDTLHAIEGHAADGAERDAGGVPIANP